MYRRLPFRPTMAHLGSLTYELMHDMGRTFNLVDVDWVNAAKANYHSLIENLHV